MTDGKQGWKWWQQAALGAGVLLFVPLCLVIGFRQPWIKPLPGVRLEMTRPFIRESDLGPDSAYFLMLEAIRPPAAPLVPVQIWGKDWSDALAKFNRHPWPDEPPPPAVEAEPGEEKLGANPSPSPEAPWTREQYEDILRLVRLHEPQVALLDRALAAPDPQMPTLSYRNMSVAYLQEVRQMARWLAVSGHYRAGTGDFAGAFRDFGRLLGLGNLVCRGGSFINLHVGWESDAMAAEAAWVVASRERVPAPVLRAAARAFLAADDEAEPFVEAIRAEGQVMVDSVIHLYRIQDRSWGILQDHVLLSYPARSCFFAVAPLMGSTPDRTAGNLEACFQHLVALAEQPYRPDLQTEYDTLDARLRMRSLPELLLRTRDPYGLLIAGMATPHSSVNHIWSTRNRAVLRGMALYLAVRAYETEHGEPPETLDALVPDYLPRIPEDPFDGQPFRYLRRNVPSLPPEAWAVYSIGENFTDDGGTTHGAGTHSRESGTSSRYILIPLLRQRYSFDPVEERHIDDRLRVAD